MTGSISVVLPAFNEQQALPPLVTRLIAILESYSADFEIIIINDGSTDQTPTIASELAQNLKNVRCIHHHRNLGFGEALKTGISAARMEYWVWLPSDGEFRPEEFQKLIDHTNRNPIVVGYPIEDTRIPVRRILSATYQRLLRQIFRHNCRYFNGPVLYRRNLISGLSIRSSGFSATAEILIRALENNPHFIEIPLKLSPRNGGRSQALRLSVLYNIILSWSQVWWDLHMKRAHRCPGS